MQNFRSDPQTAPPLRISGYAPALLLYRHKQYRKVCNKTSLTRSDQDSKLRIKPKLQEV